MHAGLLTILIFLSSAINRSITEVHKHRFFFPDMGKNENAGVTDSLKRTIQEPRPISQKVTIPTKRDMAG